MAGAQRIASGAGVVQRSSLRFQRMAAASPSPRGTSIRTAGASVAAAPCPAAWCGSSSRAPCSAPIEPRRAGVVLALVFLAPPRASEGGFLRPVPDSPRWRRAVSSGGSLPGPGRRPERALSASRPAVRSAAADGEDDRLRRAGDIAVQRLNPGDIGERSGPRGGECDLPRRRNRLPGDTFLRPTALHVADLDQHGVAPGLARHAPGGCKGSPVVARHGLCLGDAGKDPAGFARTRHATHDFERLGDQAQGTGPVSGLRLRFGDLAERVCTLAVSGNLPGRRACIRDGARSVRRVPEPRLVPGNLGQHESSGVGVADPLGGRWCFGDRPRGARRVTGSALRPGDKGQRTAASVAACDCPRRGQGSPNIARVRAQGGDLTEDAVALEPIVDALGGCQGAVVFLIISAEIGRIVPDCFARELLD